MLSIHCEGLMGLAGKGNVSITVRDARVKGHRLQLHDGYLTSDQMRETVMLR